MNKKLPLIFLLGLLSINIFAYTQDELLEAINNSDPSRVETILQSGISPDFHDNEGFSPLAITITLHNQTLFDLLVTYGANIDFLSDGDECPLATAVIEGNAYALQRLLEEDADFYIERTSDFLTPIMLAINVFNLDCLEILCGFNADIPNTPNSEGKTPLAFAQTKTSLNKERIIDILLNFGAMEA